MPTVQVNDLVFGTEAPRAKEFCTCSIEPIHKCQELPIRIRTAVPAKEKIPFHWFSTTVLHLELY